MKFQTKGNQYYRKKRANDWNTDDRFDDEYKDNLISKKNQPASEKGYDTDYAATSKTHTDRIPLQSPFQGEILRKTNGTISRDPLYKELNKRIINSSTSTEELSDGKKSENQTSQFIHQTRLTLYQLKEIFRSLIFLTLMLK